MNWAERRKLQYLSGLIGFILIVLFIFLYPVIFKKPTCQDGKKNGNETGIDCGGDCIKICAERTSEPVILWNRAFRVTDNAYNLVANIENQNRNSAVQKVFYQFRVYDDTNRLIGTREGSTYIPPNKQFIVFESRFNPGLAKVKSTTFAFTERFDWEKKEPTLDTLPVTVDNIVLGDDIYSPSLSARVKNDSIYNLPSFTATAILSDKNQNVIHVSKTFVEGLKSNSNTQIYFTWLEEFDREVAIKDIIIEINPFSVNF